MNGSLLTSVMLFSAAFICALGAAIALVIAADKSRIIGRWYIPLFVPVVLFGIAFKTVALRRNLTRYSEDTTTILGGHSALAEWVLRLGSALIIGISIALILSGLFSRTRSTSFKSTILITGFFSYFFFGTITNGLLGTIPSLDYKLSYYLFVFLGIHFSIHRDINLLADTIKFCGLITICAGLLLIGTTPSLVIQPNYVSLIPFISIRFWGIDAHANGLGPLCAVVTLLLIWRPIPSKFLQYTFLASTISALILTQSKTAIVAFFIALLVWGVFRFNAAMVNVKGPHRIRTSMALGIAFSVIASTLIIYMWSDASLVSGSLNKDAVKSASTLTGRGAIWAASIAEFERNPPFGYGNKLWGPEFADANHLLGVASNAHNQIIEVIASAGILGLIGFLLYLGALIYGAWMARENSNGFSIALMTFLIVRGITEVPFKINNLMSNDFVIHMLLFALLCWTPGSRKPRTEITNTQTRPVHA